MTVATLPITQTPVLAPQPLQAGGTIALWAQAASDAARLVAPLVKTDFVPTHFRGNVEAATAAVLYGAEAGLSPMQALQGVYVIQGRPAMYARTMLAIVLGRGHDVWVEDASDSRVVVCGRRKGSEKVERVIWSIDRAAKAGYTSKNQRYKTNPQEMLTARGHAEVCRRIAPDALLGMAYAAEELWDEDADGQPVVKTRTVRRSVARQQPALPAPAPTSQPAPAAAASGPPLPGEEGYEQADGRAEDSAPEHLITDAQMKKMHASFNDLGITDRDDRLAYAAAVIGREITSSKELTQGEASVVIDQLVTDAEPQASEMTGDEAAGQEQAAAQG